MIVWIFTCGIHAQYWSMADHLRTTIPSGGEEGVNATFRALVAPERRVLLDYLIEEYPANVPVSSAIAQVARTTNEPNQQVELQLFHTHLPKMEKANIISYDEEEELLAFAGDETAEELLEVL